MCAGVPIFANNKKALYGKGTNSHSEAADLLGIKEDDYRNFEYLWWKKKLVQTYIDRVANDILRKIDSGKASKLAQDLVKKEFNTDTKLAKWLNGVPNEWDKLMEPKFKLLAKKVNPKLIIYHDKITKFKKTPIEKFNPYQATKLPKKEELRRYKELDQVRAQVWDQVRDQVWDQVWDQVRDQVWDQVRATSYWAVKITLGLPTKHWFFDF